MSLTLSLQAGLLLQPPTFTPSPYSPEADVAFAAMAVQPTAPRKVLYDNLIKSLKSAGVWDRLDALWVLAAANAQAASVNLKVPSATALAAINAPTFAADRGYTGDGLSSYVDTGFNPVTTGLASQNNIHLGVWSRTAAQSPATADIGGTTNNFNIALRSTVDQVLYRINHSAATNLYANTDGSGHFVGNRSSSTNIQGYRQGALVGENVAASTASMTTGNVFLHRRNNTGTYSERQLSAAHVGQSLTAGQASALYTALQNYMTAVGA